jgi:soluble lytic murein transglycosylase-like protein
MKALLQVEVVMAMFLLAASSSWAQSSADLIALFDAPCARYGVPKQLAVAVAAQESGGRPWALNIARRSIFYASKEEALLATEAALRSGTSFSIGVMQVNSWWLRRYNLPLELVYEPRGNIQVGVWILAQAIKRYGLTWQALAAYNTGSADRYPESGRAYAEAVLARLHRYSQAVPSMSSSTPRQASPAGSPMVVYKRREVASNEK